jgi:hypothetical protein
MLDPLFDIPVNIKGVKGDPGKDGLSAYEVWLQNGNVGSEKTFLESLKGKDGETIINEVIREVIKEKPVVTKEITKEVVKEVKGKDGLDGKSAYQLWKSLGNKGSVEDFILSLRGEDGLSAFEIWLSLGNTGTEKDFIDSLKGQDGRHTYSTGQTGGKFGVLGAGEIGRLDFKETTSITDDLTILRNGSLFRVDAQAVSSTAKNYTIVSDDYTVEVGDYYIEVDTINKTITLDENANLECHIDNSSNGFVYVTPVGSNLETLTLEPNEGSYFVYNGSNWRVK